MSREGTGTGVWAPQLLTERIVVTSKAERR